MMDKYPLFLLSYTKTNLIIEDIDNVCYSPFLINPFFCYSCFRNTFTYKVTNFYIEHNRFYSQYGGHLAHSVFCAVCHTSPHISIHL